MVSNANAKAKGGVVSNANAKACNGDVPFFGLDRQYARYRETFLGITDRVLSSGQVLQGEAVRELEGMLCAITQRKHGIAVGSCTDALAFTLSALGIGAGDEVLVTSLSFVASASPILRVGARPRFVDIDPRDYMMSLEHLESCIDRSTKAILAVHMYGQALPMQEIEEIATRWGLVLIEDAAQGLGAQSKGRPVGSLGHASCLSFDPTKVIGSFSSAGAVVTDDPEIARRVIMQRYHGRDPGTREYDSLGYNSQLSTEMAAMLVFKLSKMCEWEAERSAIATVYREGLADLSQQLTLPFVHPERSHNWHKFVIRATDREGLIKHLTKAGVQSMVHYPKALCDTALFSSYRDDSDVPEARAAARTVLSLPIFADLTRGEAKKVVGVVREYYEQRRRTPRPRSTSASVSRCTTRSTTFAQRSQR